MGIRRLAAGLLAAVMAVTAMAAGAAGSRPSTLTLSSSRQHATTGEEVVLTALVSPPDPSAPSPSGEVTFTEGLDIIATVRVQDVEGAIRARLITSALGEGVHQIVARYSGDQHYAPATSMPFAQFVVIPQP